MEEYVKIGPLEKPHRCCICQRRRKAFTRSDYSRWDYFCSECVDLTGEAKAKAVEEATERAANKVRPKKAYPIIGGPLNGLHATTDDMYADLVAVRDYGKYKKGDIIREGGMYGHVGNEYQEYNNASRNSKSPSMIFVHESCLAPVISAKER